jgi:adenine deaminase
VAGGVDPLAALRAATLNPVRHYRLDLGLMQPGDAADFLVVDSLETLNVREVWLRGERVVADGEVLAVTRPAAAVPPNRIATPPRRPAEFAVRAERPRTVRVIDVAPGRIVTGSGTAQLASVAGSLPPDPGRDVLKLAVVNRYRPAPPAVGFVRGFGLRRGALATSVAHDSHNLLAVGTSDEELCAALNLVIDAQGGLAAVGPHDQQVLPLPVAGLMCPAGCREAALACSRLDAVARALGTGLPAPFMTLSFLALLVIPSLRLGDRGLFAADTFRFVDVFAD